jgi:hypothetical protein
MAASFQPAPLEQIIESQLGVMEKPKGSNWGPEVKKYLDRAYRVCDEEIQFVHLHHNGGQYGDGWRKGRGRSVQAKAILSQPLFDHQMALKLFL